MSQSDNNGTKRCLKTPQVTPRILLPVTLRNFADPNKLKALAEMNHVHLGRDEIIHSCYTYKYVHKYTYKFVAETVNTQQ